MYRKHWFLVLFFTLFVSIIQTTPDRHQYVYDNLQSHSNHLIEEYIIEKFMKNGNTTIIKQIKLTDQNEIENILINEYIYLTIDLDDNINTYRKVIMINYP
jgi:hypothetical protein